MFMASNLHYVAMSFDKLFRFFNKISVQWIFYILHGTKYASSYRVYRSYYRQRYVQARRKVGEWKYMLPDSKIATVLSIRMKRMMHREDNELIRVGKYNILQCFHHL